MADIPAFLKSVQWSELPPRDGPELVGLPHATHSGVWEFSGLRLRVYRLDDGRAIIDADDFRSLLATMGMLVEAPEESQ